VKVSGPLQKGRLWLSTALDAYYVVNVVNGLPKGQDQATSSTGSDLTRLQWNITGSQILTASFLGNLSDDKRNGLSVLSPAETTVNTRQSIYMGALKDQWMVGGGLVEFGFADSRTYLRSSPQGDQAYVVTPFGASGNFFSDQTQSTGRQEWLANGFLAPLHGHGWLKGSHQIQIGTDVEHSDLNQTILRNEYTSVRVDGSLVRDVQFLAVRSSSKTIWKPTVTRWTGGLPLRGSCSKADSVPNGISTRVAPVCTEAVRAWAPKWAGGAKFSAGWGVFYDAVTLGMLALSQEQTSISTFYGPTGAVTAGPVQSSFVLRPSDLRLPRFALSSFAAERKLPFQLYGKLSLISREGSRGFTFQDTVVSPSLNLYVLDNIQRQRYRAGSFALRRTFLSKYQWFASYTRSEARANAVINYSIENPIFAPQSGGPLPWDAPNRVLAWGWAPVEKTWFPGFMSRLIGETDAQLLFDYRTGFLSALPTKQAGWWARRIRCGFRTMRR